MYVNWQSLYRFGILFWGLLIFTDLLGECSWKQHSEHLKSILNSKPSETPMSIKDDVQPFASKTVTWSVLIWNMFAFVCAIIFCSFLKSTSWIIWRIIKIYHVARNRKSNVTVTETDSKLTPELNNAETKPKLVFKNQLYATKQNNALVQEHNALLEQFDHLKKEKHDLKHQLILVQKENLEARQQVEEFKLESIMVQEKLLRTTNTLKENMKYKDMSTANQEIVERKAHNLEIHLREVSRDRDHLRVKLGVLEKKYSMLEERVRDYEKHESESNIEQLPVKDTQPQDTTSELVDTSTTEPEVDMSTFQKKILELQRNIQGANNNYFESSSKISVDLDDSSMDTYEKESRKPDINVIKQHIMNYNAYKVQMLRPKMKLADLKNKMYKCQTDTTGSSSDECSANRLISGSVEFQNFLKNLSSTSSINYHGAI